MCDTMLASYTVSLLIDVACCSLEEFNVLSYLFFKDFYPCLSVKFVTYGHTVGRKGLTGCGDSVSWTFFMGVSILITSGWVFVPMITTFRQLYFVRQNQLCVRTNIVGRKKYRNIKDYNNNFPNSNDKPLFYTFFDHLLSILATLYILSCKFVS